MKNKWKMSCQSKKRICLLILNEDVNDFIKVIKSLEDSRVLIDGLAEIIKHEIKNPRSRPLH